MENRSFMDVGGTQGGLGEFLMGVVMMCVGGYLLSNRVTVVGSYWSFYGANSFGITLIPMLFGVGLLFFRQECDWMGAHRRRRALHIRWSNCQYALSTSARRRFLRRL